MPNVHAIFSELMAEITLSVKHLEERIAAVEAANIHDLHNDLVDCNNPVQAALYLINDAEREDVFNNDGLKPNVLYTVFCMTYGIEAAIVDQEGDAFHPYWLTLLMRHQNLLRSPEVLDTKYFRTLLISTYTRIMHIQELAKKAGVSTVAGFAGRYIDRLGIQVRNVNEHIVELSLTYRDETGAQVVAAVSIDTNEENEE